MSVVLVKTLSRVSQQYPYVAFFLIGNEFLMPLMKVFTAVAYFSSLALLYLL